MCGRYRRTTKEEELARTSADASQDSTPNVMADWGLAKVNRADWRLNGSAAARLAQNLQWKQAAKRKTVPTKIALMPPTIAMELPPERPFKSA
jgi:hypothetical protein